MDSRMLKINWILPRPGLSGGVKSNRLIAEAMVRRGHTVNLVYANQDRPKPDFWRVRKLIRYWLSRYKSKDKQQHHLESSSANLMPVSKRVISADDVPDADVSIATWWETAYWVNSWPACKGIKAYFIRHHELHGGDPEKVADTYRLPLKKLVIATWLKKLMAETYGDDDAALIPNGVDWSQFNFRVRDKQPIPTIGLLYGIVKWKGAMRAFEAIRQVQKRLPKLKVVCFGAHLPSLQENLPMNFEYYFRPDQEKIPELYRMTDCWLLPSTLEGFGMPGLEAAACGCPVVSTRCGGPEDYVSHGHNGYLVDVDDVEDMAERIYQVVTMDSERWRIMSRNSAEYVKRFDWDRSAEILEQVLFSYCNENISKQQSDH